MNLCPFAKAVYVKQQVRFVLGDAEPEDDLLEELGEELLRLRDTPADEIGTTLLVHPQVLSDFLDYNDFSGAPEPVQISKNSRRGDEQTNQS